MALLGPTRLVIKLHLPTRIITVIITNTLHVTPNSSQVQKTKKVVIWMPPSVPSCEQSGSIIRREYCGVNTRKETNMTSNLLQGERKIDVRFLCMQWSTDNTSYRYCGSVIQSVKQPGSQLLPFTITGCWLQKWYTHWDYNRTPCYLRQHLYHFVVKDAPQEPPTKSPRGNVSVKMMRMGMYYILPSSVLVHEIRAHPSCISLHLATLPGLFHFGASKMTNKQQSWAGGQRRIVVSDWTIELQVHACTCTRYHQRCKTHHESFSLMMSLLAILWTMLSYSTLMDTPLTLYGLQLRSQGQSFGSAFLLMSGRS